MLDANSLYFITLATVVVFAAGYFAGRVHGAVVDQRETAAMLEAHARDYRA